MRRFVAVLLSLAIISLVAIVTGAGATAAQKRKPARPATASTKISGTWAGTIQGSSSQKLTVEVNNGERKGTWSVSASCHGTLSLKNISNGFHHFNRVVASGATCDDAGVDCLKRDGSQLLDEYQSNGDTSWSTGLLTRTH